MRGLAVFLVAIGCSLLWMGLAAPAILRSFGVPISFGSRRIDRRNKHLNKMHYLWGVGVFSFGLGMFLFFATWKYLEWKLLGQESSPPSAARAILGLLFSVAVGLSWGMWSAPRRKSASLDRS